MGFSEIVLETVFSIGKPIPVCENINSTRIRGYGSARNLWNFDAFCLSSPIDVKVNDKEFIDEITNLIGKISDGDLIISSLLTLFNSDQFPNPEFLSGYKGKIINWVVEQ